MTDEDTKLILEWCGFKFSEHIFGCWYPDDKLCHKGQPSLDLNFYFKYAVPKLYEQSYYYDLMQWNIGQHKAIINQHTVEWAVTAADAIDKDPAEAFGQALVKFIKDKK